jgi:hypothetical protein
MKVARTLLLVAALFALNSSEPSAALPTPVLHEADGLLSSIQALLLDFDVPRMGAGRPAAAPISNTLALLGMGLLLLLGARITRRR